MDGRLDSPHAALERRTRHSSGRHRRRRYRDSVATPARTAAFFDLDKTIIAKSSVLAFGRPFYQGGLINRRAVLRSAYAQFMFALAGADADQIERMRAYLTSMCTGWDVAQVRDIVSETLHEIIDPIVYDEAVDLIAMHKAAGRDVVIVSTSGEEVVGADRRDARRGRGRRHADGRRRTASTPARSSRYAYGPEKAVAVRALAEQRGYDLAGCYAYSDSATDVPMLEAVGHPYAVNADRALRKVAAERRLAAADVLQRGAAARADRRHAAGAPGRSRRAWSAPGVAAAGLVWYATRRRASRT